VNPSPNRDILLQDYSGLDVANWIGADPTPAFVALTQLAYGKIAGYKKQLNLPTGRYNCYGLALASRRTALHSPPEVARILQADQYKVVGQPQIGDLAIYRSIVGEIDHIGLVTRVELGAVFVWSKWGQLGEFEHHQYACPYTDCTIEYMRLV
jgi:hypothetical protein